MKYTKQYLNDQMRIFNLGVKYRNNLPPYKSIQLSMSNETVDLRLAGGSDEYSGVDIFFTLATSGVASPPELFRLYMDHWDDLSTMFSTGPSGDTSGFSIASAQYSEIKEDPDSISFGFELLVDPLRAMGDRVQFLLSSWDRAQLINFVEQSASSIQDEYVRTAEHIADSCLGIISAYTEGTTVALGEAEALKISALISSSINEMTAKINNPPRFDVLSDVFTVADIRQKMSKHVNSLGANLSSSMINYVRELAASNGRFDKELARHNMQKSIYSFQAAFHSMMAEFSAKVAASMKRLCSGTDSFAKAVEGIMNMQLSRLENIARKRGIIQSSVVCVSGVIKIADSDDASSFVDFSDNLNHVFMGLSAMAYLRGAAVSAAEEIKNMSVHNSTDLDAYTQRSEGVAPPSLETGLSFIGPKAQKEDTTELDQGLRAAASLLVSRGMYKEAADIVRPTTQTEANENIVNTIENLSMAMGSMLESEREAGQAVSGAGIVVDNILMIVCGDLLDSYKTEWSGDKIAIPIDKNLPNKLGSIRLLKSIDSIIVMMTFNKTAFVATESALRHVYEHRPEKYHGQDAINIVRKCKNAQDVAEMMRSIAFTFLGMSFEGARAADGEQSLDNWAHIFIGDSAVEVKESLLRLIRKKYNLGMFGSKMLESGRAYNINISKDMDSLGIVRGEMYQAAVRAYKAFTQFNILNGSLSSTRRRAEAYYRAGRAMAMAIKDGKLPEYAHMVQAAVRSDSFTKCPFRLNIPEGCSTVGNNIDKLHVVSPKDDKRVIEDKTLANNLAWKRMTKNKDKCKKCRYLRNIMTDEHGMHSVVCNYGEANAGADSIDFTSGLGGSYPSTFQSGLFSVPNAIGPEARDSYMARSPGVSPFGNTWSTVGM